MPNALVIGASGGIGAALADHLAASHAVTRLSRRHDGLDVTDEASVARHLGALPPIDLAFVATGILAPPGGAPEKALEAVDADALAAVFAANAIGPALVLKHLAPRLGDAARVGVLTARVGSISDNRMGGWYAYRAAKAAANQITRTAAIEIARRRKGSVVAALHPGTVETAFTEGYKAPKVAPEEAAANLVRVLATLAPAQSGGFFAYDGAEIPW
ncbi:SDR family NAD(P)-dependent oxidoreductase [Jannaschia sp. W003]|uniref:SDR family NAD(P)-dependent oxidoreductase n=1 Tax=Jannaschia sp. W003 TaxID=2867012 RepID=UPI0021A45D63|nr:SDR family NAD(P)-dependent oxidoreductase [Jannaschia sp. W003]UWQ22506.1 SDR family NAD(P)-dependent oxidoreductase [Jannaschia sp. W003]